MPKVQSADKIVQNLSGGKFFAVRFKQLKKYPKAVSFLLPILNTLPFRAKALQSALEFCRTAIFKFLTIQTLTTCLLCNFASCMSLLPTPVFEPNANAHTGPRRYMFYLMTHHGDIPQEHEQREEYASNERPTKKNFDTLCYCALHKLLHECLKMYGRRTQPYGIDKLRIACKGIAHVVFNAVSMERRPNESAHIHVQNVEDRKRLEKMLKRHDGMQTPHERYAQYAV